MKSSKPRKTLFERLESGLLEGIRHMKGEVQLRTTVVSEPPAEAVQVEANPSPPAENASKP